VKRKRVIILSATILVLLLGGAVFGGAGNGAGNGVVQPPITGERFTDVPKDHWAYADLEYLAERGIITGLPGGQYKGEEPLDRYSAAALIARAIKYLQNNPESVTPQDLDVLKDLIFKVSDRLSTLEGQLGQGANASALEGRVAQNEQAIAQLRAQGVGSTDAKLASRVNANFIISLTALLVGIIAVALATLGI
jgi:hypothetical protein